MLQVSDVGWLIYSSELLRTPYKRTYNKKKDHVRVEPLPQKYGGTLQIPKNFTGRSLPPLLTYWQKNYQSHRTLCSQAHVLNSKPFALTQLSCAIKRWRSPHGPILIDFSCSKYEFKCSLPACAASARAGRVTCWLNDLVGCFFFKFFKLFV